MSKGKRIRVQINYKSGISVITEVDSLSVTRSVTGAGLASITGDEMRPRPLYFGIDAIESVWELL